MKIKGRKEGKRSVATHVIDPHAMNKTLKRGSQGGESKAYRAVEVPPDT